MNLTNKALAIDQAKQIDMVSYLASLGFEPSKIVHDDYWYHSPLREERTASFKINRRLNRWYDHGIGKGGNLINFGMLYFNCSFGDFLKQQCSTISLNVPLVIPYIDEGQRPSKITILKEFPLYSSSLLEYLKERKIPLRTACKFCSQVSYSVNNKIYYGIGFKNDLGGFEIRNPNFKSSSAPKAVTTYGHNNNEVVVFEGFFDFLSYKTFGVSGRKKQDFLILNSLSFLEKARPYMEKYQLISLYLDRDKAGEEHTMRALSWSNKYKDQSHLYKGYKDLNEWAVYSGESDKKLNSSLRL